MPFRKDGRCATTGQAVLQRFILAGQVRIEFGQFLVFGREGGRFFQTLFTRLAQLGNLALQSFALSSQGLELFAILLLDRVEPRRERLAD